MIIDSPICNRDTVIVRGNVSPFPLLSLLFPTSFLSFDSPPYVARAGLELMTLLLQPPKFWNYRCCPTTQHMNIGLLEEVVFLYGFSYKVTIVIMIAADKLQTL